MSSSWFKVKELTDSVFMIQEPFRRLAPDYLTNTLNIFVIHDKKESMVIDCGTGIFSIRNLVLEILGKRTIITPFLTHSDWDHTGSLNEFKSALLHEEEILHVQNDEDLDEIRLDVEERNDPILNEINNPFVRKRFSGQPIHVKNGEWLRVGGMEIQIIYLPGHSKGSIGLWYPDEKFFFVGDALQTGYVYADKDPKQFFKTLEKMNELEEMYFLPAHENILLQKSDLNELIQIFINIENNNFVLTPIKNRYLDNLLYKGEKFSILLPAKGY